MLHDKCLKIGWMLGLYGTLSDEQIMERIGLIKSLEETIKLIGGPVKGITIFGSILTDRFNDRSDIDFATIYELGGDIFEEVRVREAIQELTKREGHPCLAYTPGETYWVSQHVPFGVYLGDEDFRRDAIKEILYGGHVDETIEYWDHLQHSFNWFGQKDLTNPEGSYKLSEFDRLREKYSL